MITTALHPALAHPAAGTATVAVVAPREALPYAQAFARRGWRMVSIGLAPHLRPLALPATGRSAGCTDMVEHTGSLRRTVKKLRPLGVSAVIAASPEGIELADRLAWQLGLPGPDPATSVLRRDRGAQATALTKAGIAAPRGVYTTSLAYALEWARFCAPPRFLLAPAAAGIDVAPVSCEDDLQISSAWPEMRRAAARHTRDAHLVLTEELTGPRYRVNSSTHLGPDGTAHHDVTDIWSEVHTPDGLLDRSDLLDRQPLLARVLTMYIRRVLDALGVVSGPVSSHIVYTVDCGPVLLSALAVPGISPADDALRSCTGHDRLGTALDAVTAAQPAWPTPAPAGRHIVRVRLHTHGSDGIEPRLLRSVRQLPTAVAVSPSSHEVVLSHARSQAVEADYQAIRALERDHLHEAGCP
ncbi:hypothetical protein [Streptomyces sp. NPDC006335]|uniref:hypothetical protein n=1 Tax=Streptomyces sp. NPDC006335 TaxID=3156895 RepID=UPI0033A54442